jgi:hypothetical protein
MSKPAQSREAALKELHARLGYKHLSRTWAKVELLGGLAVAGGGLILAAWGVSRPEGVQWEATAGGWALFVLGGYLLLAGQRSHLYQSQNEQTACLLEAIQSESKKGASE